jgi:hypothetical protein
MDAPKTIRSSLKKCGRCFKLKETYLFPSSKQTRDGFGCYCKLCRYKYGVRYRELQKIQDEQALARVRQVMITGE